MKYFDIFTDYDTFISNWDGIKDAPTDAEILFAYYGYEDYSGYAFVVFERDGKLFEAQDAHCSCNGLEVWRPEETTWAALAMRNYDFSRDAKKAFKALVQSKLRESRAYMATLELESIPK